jgi:hypothetical protein
MSSHLVSTDLLLLSLEIHIEILDYHEKEDTNRCNWHFFDFRQQVYFLALRLETQKDLSKFMKFSIPSILNMGPTQSCTANVNFYHMTWCHLSGRQHSTQLPHVRSYFFLLYWFPVNNVKLRVLPSVSC